MRNYNRLKEVLAKHGVSNLELAEKIGKDPQTISNYCTNKHQPDLATLFDIGSFLGIEPKELITESKDLRVPKKKKAARKK